MNITFCGKIPIIPSFTGRSVFSIIDYQKYGRCVERYPTSVHPSSRLSEEGDRMSILIRDTTREERERIVAESIENISGLCDGCSPGIIEMYQDYIDGKRELREINMEFNARYISGKMGPERNGCDYQ